MALNLRGPKSTKILSKPLQATYLTSASFKSLSLNSVEWIPDRINSWDDHTIRVKGSVIGVAPIEAEDFCKAFCTNCSESFSFKDLGLETMCRNCTNVLVPVFNVVFFVASGKMDYQNRFIEVFYYSPVDEKPDPLFFGV